MERARPVLFSRVMPGGKRPHDAQAEEVAASGGGEEEDQEERPHR